MPGEGTKKKTGTDREAQIKQVRALSAEEFLDVEIPDKEPIVDGLIHKRDQVAFAARRRHGKTSLVTNLAVEGAVGAENVAVMAGMVFDAASGGATNDQETYWIGVRE